MLPKDLTGVLFGITSLDKFEFVVLAWLGLLINLNLSIILLGLVAPIFYCYLFMDFLILLQRFSK